LGVQLDDQVLDILLSHSFDDSVGGGYSLALLVGGVDGCAVGSAVACRSVAVGVVEV
jgi:hypothetical protein